MRRQLFLICILSFLSTIPLMAQEASVVQIGVLAKRGKELTMKRWDLTAVYLSDSIPEYQFKIIPLSFEEVEEAVVSRHIQFLFVNSAMYVDLAARYAIERIATVKRSLMGESHVLFGGVVFARNDNKTIHNFEDLKGRSFAAVNERSLGGWIVAWRELVQDGLDPDIDFAEFSFLGTHDAVVHAVLRGEVDAGTVRTDTLERMAAEGKINPADINVLLCSYCRQRQDTLPANFPFRLSTRLYPEWPMAKLAHVSNELAEGVAFALIGMPDKSPAAIQAQIKGWTVPKNYREVDRAFQELGLSIYADIGSFSLWDSILKYWHAFLLGGISFVAMLTITIYIISLNRRLKESESRMRSMATHDNLTGLPNRSLFIEFSNKALANAQREKTSMAIIFMDLDRFKHVNDIYGHKMGDEVLQNVASRLKSHLRKEDIVARIGGDEFVGLLYNATDLSAVRTTVSRIIADISAPYFIVGKELHIGCSIGVAIFPEHGNQIESLLQLADKALYTVKKEGRGHCAFCDGKDV